MEAWIQKLQKRMTKFLQNPAVSAQQKLDFIRHQYGLLDIIVKAIDGKVYFVGCSQPNQHDD